MRRWLQALLLALAASVATGAALAQTHDHRFAPPAPDTLGGSFQLRDVHGRTVSMDDLRGRWTLLYFGYSRCSDTCPVALPTIVRAANKLRGMQIPARAVFVDIEPPSGAVRPRDSRLPVTHRGHHVAAGEVSAFAGLQQRFGPDLLALTGTRAELSAATIAFQVRREHVPPRPAETGHSINHTSFIYLTTPEGRVVQYFPHSAAPDEIIQAVRRRQNGS